MLFQQLQRMLHSPITLPAEMSRYDIASVRVLVQQPLHRRRPFFQISIADKSQAGVFCALNKASAIQYLMLINPQNNIILRMSFTGVVGFNSVPTNVERGVIPESKFSPIVVFFFTKFVCQPRAVCSYSHLFELLETRGTVVVNVGGDRHDYGLPLPSSDSIDERQQLTSIPRRIKKNYPFIGDQVHTV